MQYTYSHVASGLAFAIFDGMSGWKQIATISPDGVSNVLLILKLAQSKSRKVHVYLGADDKIYGTYI